MPEALETTRALLAEAHRLLLITHVSPDGDAVGSLLGLGWALRAAGKTVTLACADPVPDTYAYLAGWDEVTDAPAGEFDVTIVLDAADAARTGKLAARLEMRPADVVFDHHITNPGFGRVNHIDPQASSTAELLTEWLPLLGLPLTQPAAEALLTGVLTDTLRFRTSNTTPRTLATTQILMQAGASLHSIYTAALFRRPLSAVRLWGAGLADLQLADSIVWARLPARAREASGYPYKDDADLINVLTSVREAAVAVMLIERDNGLVKVSWRSMSAVNVARLAQQFGGGGHAPAAGAEIPGTLDEVERLVLAATRQALQALEGKAA